MLHRLRPIVLAVLALIATVAIGAQAPSQAQLLQEGLRLLETRGDARAATRVFEQAAQGPDRGVSARAWLYLGMALEKLGRDQARREYERVVRDFSDQADIVAEARRRLAALTHNVPPSQQRPITMRRAFLESDPGNRVVRERLARRTRARIWRRARRDRPRRHGHRSARAHRRRARTRAGLARGGSPGWPRRDLRARLGRRQRARVARAGEPTGVLLRAPRGDAIANVDWPIRDQLVVQVQHSDTTASLHVVDAATHTSRQILNLAAAAGRVSLSPDGRFIVYDAPAPEGTAHDLFIVRTNGGDVTRLTDDPFDDGSPAWTTRGDRILFISDRTGATSLWSLPMKDGRATGPVSLVQSDLGGFQMVLGVTDDGAYHYLRQVGLVDVYMVTLDENGRPASEPRRVAGTFVGSNMNPAFSPDGRTIAFVAQMGRGEALGLRDVERGTARIVRTGVGGLRLPSWSPEGTRLIVKGSDTSGRYGLFVVDPQNGRTTPLVVVPPDQESSIGAGQWMPDGRAFAYLRHSEAGTVILKRDIESGNEEQLFAFEPGSWPTGWDVRHDGRLVMGIASESGTTFVIRSEDGTREIARFPAGERVGGPLLMPDGRSVLFLRIPDPGKGQPEVWRVATSGGQPEALGLRMPALRGLDVSPDGRRLAFTAGEPLREPWVIENFLPPAPAAARRR